MPLIYRNQFLLHVYLSIYLGGKSIQAKDNWLNNIVLRSPKKKNQTRYPLFTAVPLQLYVR
jgi:hypothetical protein